MAKLLTDGELTHKTNLLNRSFRKNERVQDELLDVLGFLIATRNGHRHRIDVGEAIAKTNKILKDIGLLVL